MGESDEFPSPGSDTVVNRGETYEHDRHGPVEVTAIWKGVEGVDTTRSAREKDTYIVRYSTRGGETVDELTDTLDEFVAAIDDSS